MNKSNEKATYCIYNAAPRTLLYIHFVNICAVNHTDTNINDITASGLQLTTIFIMN